MRRLEFPGGIPPRRNTEAGPQRACWACLDSGVVVIGEVRHLCDCAEGEARRREAWLLESGVPRARIGETLVAFRPIPGTEAALAAAHDFVNGKLCWLLVYGGVGNGKSHLCHGVVLACLERGRRARVVSALVLLSELRALSGSQQLSEALGALGSVPVLGLDDLIWGTDLEARWLEEVVQRRYMEKRPLMATTNRDLKDLPGPVVSRFFELGRVVLNKGKDYRRRGGA